MFSLDDVIENFAGNPIIKDAAYGDKVRIDSTTIHVNERGKYVANPLNFSFIGCNEVRLFGTNLSYLI